MRETVLPVMTMVVGLMAGWAAREAWPTGGLPAPEASRLLGENLHLKAQLDAQRRAAMAPADATASLPRIPPQNLPTR